MIWHRCGKDRGRLWQWVGNVLIGPTSGLVQVGHGCVNFFVVVWPGCGNGLAGACSGSVGLRQVFGKEALAKTLPELCPKTTNESMLKTTVTNAQPETLAKHYQNITKI